MKFKYHLSQTSELKPGVIIDNLLSKVKQKDYRFTDVTENSVTFDDESGGFVSNFKALKRFSSGKFEIFTYDDYCMVIFEYYAFSTFDLIIFSVAALAVIIWGIASGNAFEGVFITAAILLQMVIKTSNLKKRAKEILTMACSGAEIESHQ